MKIPVSQIRVVGDLTIRLLCRLGASLLLVLLIDGALVTTSPGQSSGFIKKVFAAGLKASVNRNEITVDETLTLRITAEGGISGDLDIDPLAREFEILGTSQSRQVQIVNGQMSNVQSWNIELMPKRIGFITIPALSMGGVQTDPLRINVMRAATGSAAVGGNRDLFVEAEVSSNEPWVQSEVVYVVRLFQAINILDGGLSDPTADQLKTHRLGDDVSYLTTRDGRQYRVRERKYALFAQESGDIVIPPVQLTVTVSADPNGQGGFFGQTKTLRRRGPEIILKVKPRPANLQTDWWLPATNVALTEQWSVQDGSGQDASSEGLPAQLEVGQPLTRILSLRAQGVVGEQLPEFSVPAIAGLKIYQDKPQIQSLPGADSMSASRDEKWAVIAQKTGSLTLPEISVSWFDTASGTERFAVLPETTIEVVPAATDASVPEPPVPDSTSAQGTTDSGQTSGVTASIDNASSAAPLQASSFWKGLSIFALLGWLATIVAAVMVFRRTGGIGAGSSGTSAASARAQADAARLGAVKLGAIKSSMKDGSAPEIADGILSWARSLWPDAPPRSLQAMAQRTDAALAAELQQLDRKLYSAPSSRADRGNARSDYSALFSKLQDLQKQQARHSSGSTSGRRGDATASSQGEAGPLPGL